MIRKILYVFAILLLLVGAGGYAAVRYAKPTEALDLAYGPVSILQNVLDMVKVRKPDVHISERELNDLLKRQLAERAQITPDIAIEGARFEQHADRLTAYVNLKAVGGIRIGARLDFALAWEAPELIVRHVGTRIRGWAVPASWLKLDPLAINLNDSLPPLIAISQIRFEEDGITVSLKLN